MKINRFVSAGAVVAAGLLASLTAAHATNDPNQLSPANRALYTNNHLASIKNPTVLMYDFEKTGSLETGFKDTVEADVTAIERDGRKDLSFNFLSGEHHIEFHDFADYMGNPIFMLFLERDVREMQRLNQGNALYYRNRIRNALAGSATVTPTTFTFEGKTLKGTEIRIQPYADDPDNNRYPRFAKKTYSFILSDEVPGGFYKVDSYTPDPLTNGPLMAETLTFHDAHSPATEKHAASKTGQDSVADKAK